MKVYTQKAMGIGLTSVLPSRRWSNFEPTSFVVWVPHSWPILAEKPHLWLRRHTVKPMERFFDVVRQISGRWLAGKWDVASFKHFWASLFENFNPFGHIFHHFRLTRKLSTRNTPNSISYALPLATRFAAIIRSIFDGFKISPDHDWCEKLFSSLP